MSWRSHGHDNKSLVGALMRNDIIKTDAVATAMLQVDRGDFVPPRVAYIDAPQVIGYNATISAPHMHAFALENLAPKLVEGATALDVGSGSGYLTVVMAIMVGETGKVHGIEHIPELTDYSLSCTKKNHGVLLTSGRASLQTVDGFKGLPEKGPFNAIHVGAAAPEIPPALVEQLAPGGRMFIPVGPDGGAQVIMQVDKSEDGKTVTQKKLMDVRYVPLTTRAKQLGREFK